MRPVSREREYVAELRALFERHFPDGEVTGRPGFDAECERIARRYGREAVEVAADMAEVQEVSDAHQN